MRNRYGQESWRRARRAFAEALENRTLLTGVVPTIETDPLPITDAAPRPMLSAKPAAATVEASLSVPAMNSLPGAPATLYLDFVGDNVPTWGTSSGANSFHPGVIPAFDTDGNAASFSATELSEIQDIWARVSEKYSPFDINVTTVDPVHYTVGKVTKIDVGGDGAWFGNAGGVAFVGGFAASDLIDGNFGYVFSEAGFGDDTKAIAEDASHEAGHTFGLYHHSEYQNGVLVQEYSDGDPSTTDTTTPQYTTSGIAVAPVMGVSYYAGRGLWYSGPADQNGTEIQQDDMAVISGADNGFGYRPDDVGNTPAQAKPLTVNGTAVTAAGVITQTNDVDYYSFTAPAGLLLISVSPNSAGPMLDATLEVRNANNTIIQSSDTASLGETIAVVLPSNGTYYVDVRSHGSYGDVGQYTISGTLPSDSFHGITGGPYSVAEGSTIQLNGSAVNGNPLSFAWDFNYDGVTFNSTATGQTPTFSAVNLDGPATRTIALRTADDLGTVSIVTTTLTITDVAPTATFSSNSPIPIVGVATVTFTNPADPSAADVAAGFTYSYDFNNDGTFDVTDTTASSVTVPSNFVNTVGPHSVKGRIKDKDGGFTDYTTVLIINNNPGATFTNSGPVAENTSATVTFANPQGGTGPYTYSYDFNNDGVFEIANTTTTSENISSTLLSDGPAVRVIHGRVTDSTGLFTDYTTSITVTNTPPTVTLAGAPLNSPNEGTVITFAGSGTDVPVDAQAGFTFNWTVMRNGVQIATASGSPFPLTLPDNGSYVVSLTATDKDGGVSTPATASFNVLNVAPVMSIGGTNAVFHEASPVSLTANAIDAASDLPSLAYTWSVASGNTIIATGSTRTISFTPSDSGAYTITASATDKDGATSNIASATIQVLDVPPTATFTGPAASLPEGSSSAIVTFTNQSDVAAADQAAGFQYEYDFNHDGVFDLTTSSASATVPGQYLSDGPADIAIIGRILDKDGGFTDYTAIIHVINVPPTLNLTGDDSAAVEQPYTLALSSTDPGRDTITAWNIDWGDGTTQTLGTSPAPVTHDFPASGVVLVYVTATDEDGTYSAAPKTITISPPVGAVIDTVAPVAVAGSFAPPPAGATSYTFQVTYVDNASLDLSTIDSDDIQVTAPDGSILPITFVGLSNSSSTSATAGYRFTPPGGAFNAASSGTYSFAVLPDGVSDSAGNPVAFTPLGQFTKTVPSTGPDLATQVIAKIPAQTQPGYKGTATLRVSNHGDVAVKSPLQLALYLSANNTLEASDVRLANSGASAVIAPGQSKDFTVNFTIPNSTANGKYFLIGSVTTHVAELNDMNNIATGPSTTVSRPFVDLKPSKLVVKSTGHLHSKIGTSFQLTNAGTLAAKGLATFTATLVPTRSASAGIRLGSIAAAVQVKPASSVNETLTFNMPAALPAGTYFLVLTVSPSNALGDIGKADKQLFGSTPITLH